MNAPSEFVTVLKTTNAQFVDMVVAMFEVARESLGGLDSATRKR